MAVLQETSHAEEEIVIPEDMLERKEAASYA
jgi:hypothetical protein